MRQFKLLAGFHVDETNTEHKPGAIINSQHNLAELFKEKFVEVTGSESLPVAEEKPAKKAPAAEVESAPKAPEVKTEEDSTPDVEAPEVKTEEDSTPDVEAPKPVKSKLGADVTAQFPKAVAADLKVFLDKKGRYQVTDSDATDKALHKVGLDKDEVAEFITDYTK